MALRFVDSFDHYASADITKKWTSNSSGAISAGNGRAGSQALSTNGNTVNGPSLTLDAQGTWVVGFSLTFSTLAIAGPRGIFTWYDGTTAHFTLAINASGNLVAYRGTDSGSLLGTGASVLSTGATYHIACKVVISDTVGVVLLKINGVTELNLTSQDTRNGGNATANIFQFYAQSSAAGNTWYRDDLYIMDGTGAVNNDMPADPDLRVEALYPNGNGNYSQFTGSDGNSTDNYLLVDETSSNNDTDYVASATTNNIDSYTMTNLTATAGNIIGVQTVLVARKDDAGTRGLKPHFRIGTTDYAGTTVNHKDSYFVEREIYGVSPASGSAWTISEVNGLEYGPKVA
jgi:hypothetical protein